MKITQSYFYIALFFVGVLSPGASANAADQALVPEWCGHVVPADGGPYVPGVDVNGNAVPSADVGDSPSGLAAAFGEDQGEVLVGHETAAALDWPVEIPITIDLAGRMGIAVPGADVGGEGIIGLASITRDGKVSFNGTDITAAAQGVCAPPPRGADASSQSKQKSVP